MKKLLRYSLLSLIALVAFATTAKLVKGDLITSDAGSVAATYANGRVTLAYAEYAAVDFVSGTIEVYDNKNMVATLQLDKSGNEWNTLVYSPSKKLKPGTYRVKIPSGAVKGTLLGGDGSNFVSASEVTLVVTADADRKSPKSQLAAQEQVDPDAMMADAIQEIKEQVAADAQKRADKAYASVKAIADSISETLPSYASLASAYQSIVDETDYMFYGDADDSGYYLSASDEDDALDYGEVYGDYSGDYDYDSFTDDSASIDYEYDGYGFNRATAFEPFEYSEDMFDIEGYDGFGDPVDDFVAVETELDYTSADETYDDEVEEMLRVARQLAVDSNRSISPQLEGVLEQDWYRETLFEKGALGTELLEEIQLDGRGVSMTTQNYYNETLDFDFPVRYNQYSAGEIDWNSGTKLIFKAKDKITGLYVGGDFVENASADKGVYADGLWTGELQTGDSLVLTAHDVINIESLTILYNGEDVAAIPEKKSDEIVINVDITKNDWAKIGSTVGEAIGTVSSNMPNFDHYRFSISSEEDPDNFISFGDLRSVEGKIVCTSPNNEGYDLYDGKNYTLTINAYDVPTYDAEPVCTHTFNFVGSGKPAIDLFSINAVNDYVGE